MKPTKKSTKKPKRAVVPKVRVPDSECLQGTSPLNDDIIERMVQNIAGKNLGRAKALETAIEEAGEAGQKYLKDVIKGEAFVTFAHRYIYYNDAVKKRLAFLRAAYTEYTRNQEGVVALLTKRQILGGMILNEDADASLRIKAIETDSKLAGEGTENVKVSGEAVLAISVLDKIRDRKSK